MVEAVAQPGLRAAALCTPRVEEACDRRPAAAPGVRSILRARLKRLERTKSEAAG
jgi:hypothetical protein